MHGTGNSGDVKREPVLTALNVEDRPRDSINKDMIPIEVISMDTRRVIKQLILSIKGSISNDKRKTIRPTGESIFHLRAAIIHPILRGQASVSIVGGFVDGVVVVPGDAGSVVGVDEVFSAAGEEDGVGPAVVGGEAAGSVQVDLDRPGVGVVDAALIRACASVSGVAGVLDAEHAVAVIRALQHVLEPHNCHHTLAGADGGPRDGPGGSGGELVGEELGGGSRDEHLDVLVDGVDFVVFDLSALVLCGVRERGAHGLRVGLGGVLPRGHPWLHRLGAAGKPT